ncbi:MAG TPA: hypothetical protein V6C46_06440, partial [Coleofasciculaceae cyanobacterium]
MKIIGNRVAQSAATTALVLGVSFLASAQAQTVSKALSDEAQAACSKSAASKGFEVVGVASITPRPGTTDSVDVVLSLTKGGQPYKVTCGYTQTADTTVSGTAPSPAPAAVTGASPATITSPAPAKSPAAVAKPSPTATTATTATTPAAERGSISPWWWLLVPLIGIPLLWWLLRSKDETTAASSYDAPAQEADLTTTTTVSDIPPSDGIIRSSGNGINLYSGPGRNYQITGRLEDGQRVRLSGRRQIDVDWIWVELADG